MLDTRHGFTVPSRGVLDPASFASGLGSNMFVQVVNCIQIIPFSTSGGWWAGTPVKLGSLGVVLLDLAWLYSPESGHLRPGQICLRDRF